MESTEKFNTVRPSTLHSAHSVRNVIAIVTEHSEIIDAL